MKGFKKVLLLFRKVPEDKKIIKRAGLIAETNNAELIVLHVLESLPASTILGEMLPDFDVGAAIVESVKQKLHANIKNLVPATVNVNIVVKQGIVWLEAIREVISSSCDLLLMTTLPKTWLQKIFFNSTSMNLVRKCPSPVWVMRPHRAQTIKRIVAAVDPCPSDPTRNSLNKKILSIAAELAQFERARLYIVHAWQLPGETTLSGGFVNLPPESLAALYSETEHKQRIAFDKLLEQYDFSKLKCETHFLKGDAGEVIPRFLQKKRIDLMVMGTVSRSGLKGFFIGNTAETILSQVSCSVLTLKPDGFVTPVELE